jgi:hypothetical protein
MEQYVVPIICIAFISFLLGLLLGNNNDNETKIEPMKKAEVRELVIKHLRKLKIIAPDHDRLVITWPNDYRVEMVGMMVDFIVNTLGVEKEKVEFTGDNWHTREDLDKKLMELVQEALYRMAPGRIEVRGTDMNDGRQQRWMEINLNGYDNVIRVTRCNMGNDRITDEDIKL